ncbi:Lipase-3 domain-containing protein [Aphelenchoides besseyi]|nr:Lipase-3 domain-containing protein [Aphelenchoides besseyi]KAI6201184.1 Lipase-3 domain-containing protein [Aphelenchoides besseyi]
MPSLKAFGRRWNIASDDFVFPEISEALAAAGGLFLLHSPSECKSLEWLIYLVILLLANFLNTLVCIAIAFASSVGSILEDHKRRSVVMLIYLRVPLFVLEILATIGSFIYTFGFMESAECFNQNSLRATVILEFFLIATVMFGVFMVISPHYDSKRSYVVEQRYWSRAMAMCKIRQDNLMREALDEIASLLAAFFARTDYVPSDVVAGLLLLVHCPEQQKPPPIVRRNLSANVPQWMLFTDAESMDKICRMMNFALAVYGWPSYLLNNRSCHAWCKLYKKTSCCRKRSCFPAEDTSCSNCCSCHSAAFVIEANIDETAIFFSSFRNRLYKVPFVVLADHRTSSIVITIRGSSSLFDLVTDLSLNDDLFTVDVEEDPDLAQDNSLDAEGSVRVHRGMLNSARYVYTTLTQNHVLEDILVLNPNYNICVVGHSLGAGVASLLTLLLKQTYPTCRCYAFSPPTVISKHGISETEEHVLSVIVGDDIVPRMSYQSLMHLKNEIDKQLKNNHRPKFEILIKGMYKLFFSSPWDLSSESVSTTTMARQRLIESRESDGTEVEAGESETTEEFMQRIRLYPPGRLLHLLPNGSTVEANWIESEFLNDIELTGRIISDHLPVFVRKVLRLARDQNVVI